MKKTFKVKTEIDVEIEFPIYSKIQYGESSVDYSITDDSLYRTTITKQNIKEDDNTTSYTFSITSKHNIACLFVNKFKESTLGIGKYESSKKEFQAILAELKAHIPSIHISKYDKKTKINTIKLSISTVKKEAIKLAIDSKKAEPNILKTFWFPHHKEIRLITVEEDVPLSVNNEADVFYFPKSEQVAFMSAIGIIRQDEVGKVRLPIGWGRWKNAEELNI